MSFAEYVLDLRDFFGAAGIWGGPLQMNPRGWLANFQKTDRELASHLLDGFVFLSDEMIKKQFETGFVRIGTGDLDENRAPGALQRWRDLRDNALVSYPTTNVSDSGHLFVRAARDNFGIPSARLFSLDALVDELTNLVSARPIVIVDDFSGTGDQFVRTVQKKRGQNNRSLVEEVVRLGADEAHFVVAVATSTAKKRIESGTPFRVSAGNLLPPSSSILSSDSHLVSPSVRPEVLDLIERYSSGLGLTTSDMWGYKRSGLALSFAHKTPNNTLPIFTEEVAGWTPLIQR